MPMETMLSELVLVALLLAVVVVSGKVRQHFVADLLTLDVVVRIIVEQQL